MEEIRFTKMHGIGNDYIYIDCMESEPESPDTLAREMSDRHTGVGGDGIVMICPSDKADFRMRIFNADGSEARMCGNASRCIAKYVIDQGLTDRTDLTLETLSGIRRLMARKGSDGKVESVTVDMGRPEVGVVDTEVALPDGSRHRLTAVSMGNPHGVIFTDDLSDAMVLGHGPELERHPMWPDRANIEFARTDAPDRITMRVWERGSGETMACGTGACATLVAAATNGLAGRKAEISLPGVRLTIEWLPESEGGHVMMTGPATEVFTGTYIRN